MNRTKLGLCCILLLGLMVLLTGCGGKTYTVTGQLVDGSGNPMVGVKVVATGGANVSATTGQDGNYRLDRLKGEVTVTPEKASWGFEPLSKTLSTTAEKINFIGYPGRIYKITTAVDGKGSVTLFPKQSLYAMGEKVTLTGNPELGYVFSNWEGDMKGQVNPLTINVNGNLSVKAVMVQGNAKINFDDANLENAVRKAINKPIGTLVREDIESLARLNASVLPITSLKGLENLAALNWLDLSITGITTFTEVSGLIKLQYLDLHQNQISDLSPLTRLSSLAELNLSLNKITDIGTLSWLSPTNMKRMDLSNNQITDLLPLKGLKALEKLNLSKNTISDIGSLAGLVQMKELDLSNNVVEKLDAVKLMKALEKLNASNNRLTNIDILNWLQNYYLADLNVSNNQITTVAKMSTMTTLRKLNLANNQLTDITGLETLVNLREMDLSGNQISDISKLSALKAVEKLYLHKNKITNITPLLGMTGLKEVTLMDNDLMLSTGSDAYNTIKTLRSRGIIIRYDYYENDTPFFKPAIGDKVVNEGQALTFNVTAVDPNNDALTYSVTNDNAAAAAKNLAQFFNPVTQVFSWTPSYTDANNPGETYNITFTVRDKETSFSETVHITVNNVNRAPRFTSSMADQSVNETQQLLFTVAAVDDDGDNVTYSASGNPIAAFFNPVTREFKWTPNYEEAGVYNVTFSASDGITSTDVPVKITVNNVNRKPVLDPIMVQTTNEMQQLQFTISGHDDDKEDSIVFSAEGKCANYFDPTTRTFTWTPTYDEAGVYPITFKVTDGKEWDQKSINIVVNNVDRAPRFTVVPPDMAVDEYTPLSFKVTAVDDDKEAVTYSVTGIPANAINPTTGDVNWTPIYSDVGPHTVVFKATANGTTVSSAPITVTVNDLEFNPVMEPIGHKEVNEGVKISFVVKGSDKDNDLLTYNCMADVYSDKFNKATHTFEWTPSYTDARPAPYVFTFIVTDSKGNSVSETINITVRNVDRAPDIVPIPVQKVVETEVVNFNLQASDPDGDPLTYFADPGALAKYFDPTTHTFNWLTTYDDAGTYTVRLNATDGTLKTTLDVTIIVSNLDRKPRVTLNPLYPNPLTINEYDTVAFKVEGADDDKDPLSYNALNMPVGATLDPKSGAFSWTPRYDSAGKQFAITFQAIANGQIAAIDQTIIVRDLTFQPEFTGQVAAVNTFSVNEGQNLSFQVNAVDKDNDPITYGVKPGPISVHFNPATHIFDWTPDYIQAGSYTIDFTLDDGVSPQVVKTITINVANTDRLPVIDVPGAPANAPINRLLSFKVIGSDPDGDQVALDVSSALPQGASFDKQTGIFSWTPGPKDVGDQTFVFTATSNGKTVAKSVTVNIQGPSLAFTSAMLDDSTLLPGQPVRFDLKIRNKGNVDSGAFDLKWEVYQGGAKVANQEYHDTLNPLVKGTEVAFNRSFTFNLPYGSYVMRITVDEDGSQGGPAVITKEFTMVKPLYTLTVTTIGNGTGTVTRDLNQVSYEEGTVVTLTAQPSQGSYFAGWQGDVVDNKAQIKVTVNANMTIAAVFDRLTLPRRLAYISKGFNGIYVMNSDCTQVKVNTDPTMILGAPKLSPDGTKLLFDARNASGSRWDVYMVDLALGDLNPVNMTSQLNSINKSPSWSPDGTKIVFAGNGAGSTLEIYTMEIGTKKLERITQNTGEDNEGPIFSPDGSHIISVTKSGLIIKSPSVGNTNLAVSINQGTASSVASNPVWSPDGRKLAYESNGKIYVASFTARNGDSYFEWVISEVANGRKAVWNPTEVMNSQQLAFISTRTLSQEDLYTINLGQADGLAVRVTTTDTANESDFTWSPDGSTMAVVSNAVGNKELYLLNVNSGNMTRLTYQNGDDVMPGWPWN